MSWRRLWSLIEHLPIDSAYGRATLGPKALWGATEHLLATIIDALQIHSWLYTSAHSKTTPQRPTPVTRPGDKPDRSGYTTDEMDEILATWSDRAVGEFTTETR